MNEQLQMMFLQLFLVIITAVFGLYINVYLVKKGEIINPFSNEYKFSPSLPNLVLIAILAAALIVSVLGVVLLAIFTALLLLGGYQAVSIVRAILIYLQVSLPIAALVSPFIKYERNAQ